MYTVPIYVDDEINPVFMRANGALISKHLHLLDSLPDFKSRKLKLSELWLSDYQGQLTQDEIKFDNSRVMTMFLLQWG